MHSENMVARASRHFKNTTTFDESKRIMPDLVQRRFSAERPFQLLTGDITYIWTREGWLYLAIVLDVFSRRIVGWSTSRHIDAALVCAAMRRALCGRVINQPVIFHSDRGSQYCSKIFRAMLKDAHVEQSQGISCYDNAITESFFHTFKIECIYFETFNSRHAAHATVFEYIEAYYNRTRRHTSIKNMSPVRFENAFYYTN